MRTRRRSMSRAGRRLPVLRFARRMRVKTIARLAHGEKPHLPRLGPQGHELTDQGRYRRRAALCSDQDTGCVRSHTYAGWSRLTVSVAPALPLSRGDGVTCHGQQAKARLCRSPGRPRHISRRQSGRPLRTAPRLSGGGPAEHQRARAGSTLTCTGEWSTVGNSSFGTAWHLGRRTSSRPAPSACRSRQSGRSLRTRDASALTKVVPKFRQLGGQAAPRVTHREDVQRQWCTVRQTTPRDIENITPRGPSRDDRSTATGTKEPPVGVSRRPMRPRSPSGPRRTATASKTTLELPRRSATCGSLASTVVALRVWLTCLRLVGREAVEQSSTPVFRSASLATPV